MQASWNFDAGQVVLVQGDLTLSTAQAVVNAANSRLAGGGGVDGALHAAAGPELLDACQKIVNEHGQLPPGQAVITPGFNLPAAHVIHTVGPIWRGGTENEPAILTSAYETSLALAADNGLADVAFAAISCGVYGYPLELAAPIALAQLRKAAETGRVSRAALYLFSGEAFADWLVIASQEYGREPDDAE